MFILPKCLCLSSPPGGQQTETRSGSWLEQCTGTMWPKVFTLVFIVANRNGALPICSLPSLPRHNQICEKPQIDQEKGYHNTNPGNPFSCGMFLYQRRNLFVNRLSPLTLSPVMKPNIGRISISRIDVFPSILAASPLTGRARALCPKNTHLLCSISECFLNHGHTRVGENVSLSSRRVVLSMNDNPPVSRCRKRLVETDPSAR